MSVFGPAAAEVGAFAGGTISFTWVPDPEVIAQELIATANRLEDRRGPLLISRQIAISDMEERFKTRSDPDGNPWPPWSPAYAPRGNRMLDLTGAMKDAATSPSAYPVTNESVFFNTGGMPEYWAWHQEGTGGTQIFHGGQESPLGVIGEGKSLVLGGEGRGNALPPRPFVGVSFEAQLKIIETFDQWFEGAITLGVSSKGKSFSRYTRRGTGGRFVSGE